MILATTRVEDFEQFMTVFSAAGAAKRQQHGSKGALVFRDPEQADRVFVIFEASIPNPRFGDLGGCRSTAKFWLSLQKEKEAAAR